MKREKTKLRQAVRLPSSSHNLGIRILLTLLSAWIPHIRVEAKRKFPAAMHEPVQRSGVPRSFDAFRAGEQIIYVGLSCLRRGTFSRQSPPRKNHPSSQLMPAIRTNERSRGEKGEIASAPNNRAFCRYVN